LTRTFLPWVFTGEHAMGKRRDLDKCDTTGKFGTCGVEAHGCDVWVTHRHSGVVFGSGTGLMNAWCRRVEHVCIIAVGSRVSTRPVISLLQTT